MRDLLKMLLRKKLEKRASLLNEKMAKQKSCIQCGHLFQFFNKKWQPIKYIYVAARLEVMSCKITCTFVPIPPPKKKDATGVF